MAAKNGQLTADTTTQNSEEAHAIVEIGVNPPNSSSISLKYCEKVHVKVAYGKKLTRAKIGKLLENTMDLHSKPKNNIQHACSLVYAFKKVHDGLNLTELQECIRRCTGSL